MYYKSIGAFLCVNNGFMINKKQKFGMLLSVVLKPFLRISKINLRCFQNNSAIFLK